MATKTISITEDAYEILAKQKMPNESFSVVIRRIAKKKKLSDFSGILKASTASELEKTISKSRSLQARQREMRNKKINEMMK